MNLHEYQAKKLFASYGLPVPSGVLLESIGQLSERLRRLGEERRVLKVQVHAGGRGKAGGVQIIEDMDTAREFLLRWLGKPLVSYQTSAQGQIVHKILAEECTEVERELYLGAVVDRSLGRIVFMASTEGGVAIEEVAHATPEKIFHVPLDPLTGPQPFQGRQLAFRLGLQGAQVRQFADIFLALGRMFQEQDLSLLEVNPLVVTKEGSLSCLDAKVNVDDNALHRHPALEELRDVSQQDAREVHAAEWDLSYVALEGNIGCMVNGAGLAMATMDIVNLHGGQPANFLDVGGSATRERVSEAFKLILEDPNVKAILVNIFGGIVRCDVIADGIIGAVGDAGVAVPVIVRLEGNHAKEGLARLEKSGLAIQAVQGLDEAARAAVAGVA